MPGKLNGTMAATTPERLADHHLVDAAGDVFEVVALLIMGMPQGDSTFSMARRISALAS